MVEIIPAVMPATLAELEEKATLIRGLVKTMHLDVMDGTMTNPMNWPFTQGGLQELEMMSTGASSLPFWRELDYEVDLMIKNAEDTVGDWVNTGFRRIILHYEFAPKISSVIKEWKGVVELGVAVGVDTPIQEIYPLIDQGIDFVQIMGIYQIGFQGNPFDQRALEKMEILRAAYPKVIISVDGSVNKDTAPKVIKAGANRLVIGSALFKYKLDEKMTEKIAYDGWNGEDEVVDISDIENTKGSDIETALDAFKKIVAENTQ